jgi:hypothetical protein
LLDEIEALVKVSDRVLQDARKIVERSDALKKKLAVLEARAQKKTDF